ncbi:hypothetical protein [Haladaptatus sp. DFWS20]
MSQVNDNEQDYAVDIYRDAKAEQESEQANQHVLNADSEAEIEQYQW